MTIENGNIDNNFVELVGHVCTRPAMYVGVADFEKVCCFLDGYASGRQLYCLGKHREDVFATSFQRFLVQKYGHEAARLRHQEDLREAAEARARGEEPEVEPEEEPIYPLYTNIVWCGIYKRHFKGEDDKKLLSRLQTDFEDFANPLVRMSIEVQ